MRRHIDLRRVLAVVGLSVWLVAGAAAASLAYQAREGTAGQPSICTVAPQLLKIEPELRAACSAAEETTPAEPVEQGPATVEPLGFPVEWVIWPAVGVALALVVTGIAVFRRYRPRAAV